MASHLQRLDFRRLMTAGAVSGLGDWMGTFAFMALALNTSDSSAAVGGILTLRLLPAAIGGAVVTRIVKKLGQRRSMVLTDFVRAGIVSMVPLLDELWWIYLWAFCLEGVSIVFAAARDSSVPNLADKSNLPTANALILATSYGSIPVAAGMFAAISALPLDIGGGINDLSLVFWIDALTFILSAFFIMRISNLSPPASDPIAALDPVTIPDATTVSDAEIPPEKPPENAPEPDMHLSSSFKIPLIRQIIPAVASVSIGLGALFSLGISLIRDELNASDVEFGIMILIFGVGALLGLGSTRKMSQNHLTITRYGTLGMGAVVAVMSLSPYLWGTYLGAVGFGMCATIALTSGMSTLQSSLPEKQRVLAFAIFHMVVRIGLGGSAVLTGLAGDWVGDVPVGWGNTLAGTRVVLLAAGVLVFITAWFTKTSIKNKTT